MYLLTKGVPLERHSTYHWKAHKTSNNFISKFPTQRKGEKSYGAYKVDKCFTVFHLHSPLKPLPDWYLTSRMSCFKDEHVQLSEEGKLPKRAAKVSVHNGSCDHKLSPPPPFFFLPPHQVFAVHQTCAAQPILSDFACNNCTQWIMATIWVSRVTLKFTVSRWRTLKWAFSSWNEPFHDYSSPLKWTILIMATSGWDVGGKISDHFWKRLRRKYL